MPQYRLQTAKSAQSKCRSSICGQAVILKGELRLGSWVAIGHGSYHWKHWGCVTARVIANMNNTVRTESGELNLELCDGYSELETDTFKEMVKAALERGYIDDADWRGPPGGNRPSSKGDEDEAKTPSGEPAPPKKRGRRSKAVNPDEEPKIPSGRKAGRPKKAVIMPEGAEDKEGAVPDVKKDSAANGKQPQADAEDSVNESEKEPKESPNKRVSVRNRGAKASNGDKNESEKLEMHDEGEVKIKATGAKRGRKPKVNPDGDNQEEGVSIPAKPEAKPEGKRGRPKANPVSAEGEATPAKPKPKGKRGRKPKVQAEKEATQNADDEIEANSVDDDTTAKGGAGTTAKKDDKEDNTIASDTDNVTDLVEAAVNSNGSKQAASGVKRKITKENGTDGPPNGEKEAEAYQPKKKRGRPAKKAKADN